MQIEFDPAKSARNAQERQLPFEMAADFDFESALTWQDTRRDYPEVRYVSLGPIDDRLHVLVYCETAQGIRVISLRKANSREEKRYAQVAQP